MITKNLNAHKNRKNGMLHLNKQLVSLLILIFTLTLSAFLPAATAAGNIGKVSFSDFIDPATNTLYAVGEVINTGNVSVQNTNVKIIFYNSSTVQDESTEITTIYGDTDLNVILPGRRSFYNLPLLESEGSLTVASYTTWFNWTDIPEGKPQGLTVTSSGNNTDTDGHLHVTGQIQNTGTLDSTNTEVSATFYNSTGTAIATAWAFSNPSTLAPNQTGTFDIQLTYTQQVAKVEKYRLTAESNALALTQEVFIPEFSNLLIPLALLIAATAATLTLKRKQQKPTIAHA